MIRRQLMKIAFYHPHNVRCPESTSGRGTSGLRTPNIVRMSFSINGPVAVTSQVFVDNNTLYTQFERIPFPIIGYMDTTYYNHISAQHIVLFK